MQASKALCILEKSPTNLARSPLHVALVGRKKTVVRHQLFPYFVQVIDVKHLKFTTCRLIYIYESRCFEGLVSIISHRAISSAFHESSPPMPWPRVLSRQEAVAIKNKKQKRVLSRQEAVAIKNNTNSSCSPPVRDWYD